MARYNDKPEPAEDDDDGRPWNEDRWRAFLRESELRAARYSELFETLLDDPDRDEKVAQEMGWTDGSVTNEAGPGYGFEDDDDDDADGGFADGVNDIDPNDPDLLAEAAEHRRALNAIPAYQLGKAVTMLVMRTLRPFQDVDDERLSVAREHAMLPGAKIAGGHGIGYDEHGLCGNIVLNTIALESARKAEAALTELKLDNVLPARVVDRVLPKVAELIASIELRIADLRSRVTW